jgi:hypothetical protein
VALLDDALEYEVLHETIVQWLHSIMQYPQIQWIFFNARFEVVTAVTMKNGVFWDVTPCGSCKNLRFGGI